MEHLAIMKKSWHLTERILSGKKTVESRWYSSRRAPYGKIRPGETVYFKDSGEPVALKAKVRKVLEFSGLTPKKVREILSRYGKMDGLRKDEIPKFFGLFRSKKYCVLIFLSNPAKVKPFEIGKRGFGNMSAWICAPRIQALRRQ
ncbi:MAG: ASCH domain-containing protein [archaeon]